MATVARQMRTLQNRDDQFPASECKEDEAGLPYACTGMLLVPSARRHNLFMMLFHAPSGMPIGCPFVPVQKVPSTCMRSMQSWTYKPHSYIPWASATRSSLTNQYTKICGAKPLAQGVAALCCSRLHCSYGLNLSQVCNSTPRCY